jgi:hypothetical protein
MTMNERLTNEQHRLMDLQVQIVNESKKREHELRKQVENENDRVRVSVHCRTLTDVRSLIVKHQVELERIELDYEQRLADSQDLTRNMSMENQGLSASFKVRVCASPFVDVRLDLTLGTIECDRARSSMFDGTTTTSIASE